MEAKASSVLTLAMAALLAMITSSYAKDFYVGGRQGWVQNPSESYTSWAGRYRFQVNDRLVFVYKKGEDSVVVVGNEAEYRACNTSNPIRTLDGGNSVFQLDRSGPFYFISGVPARCQAGEKLHVVVLAVRGGPRPAAPPPPAAAPTPPPSASAGPSPSPSSAGSSPSPSSAAPSPSPSSAGSSPSPSSAGPSPSPSSAGPSPSPSSVGPSPSPSSAGPSPSPSSVGPSPSSPSEGPSPALSAPAPTAGGPVPSGPTGPPASPGKSPSGSSSLGVSFGTAAAAMLLSGVALLF